MGLFLTSTWPSHRRTLRFSSLKVLRFMYDAPFYTLLQNTQDRLGEARKGTEAFAIWLGHFSGDLFYLVWIGSETGSSGAWLSVD